MDCTFEVTEGKVANDSISIIDIDSFLKLTHHLGDQARLDLTLLGKHRSLAKNEYAFRAGEPAHSVYVVEYGHLKVFEPMPDGREVLVFIRASGEILGLRGVLYPDGQGIRTYTAQACEDSRILSIPAQDFRMYLEGHPKIALEICETLTLRLNETCDKLSNLAQTQVAARVANLILYIGRCYGTHMGDGVDLNVPFTQQEIADMVGAARQTVSGILTTLKLEGVISVTQKHIRIENIEKLKKLTAKSTPLELETEPPPGDRRKTPR